MPLVHIGSPPDEWEGWESNFIHFHNFGSSPSKKGDSVTSPSFSCFNHEWKVKIYPGGREQEGTVSIFLHHCTDSEISVDYYVSFKSKDGDVVSQRTISSHKFHRDDRWGWLDFCSRTAVKGEDVLVRGSLIIEVQMKLDSKCRCQNFVPKNSFMKKMLGLFSDEDTADVAFEVKDQPESGQEGTVFHAHKLVLKVCVEGSILASICDDYDGSSPIPISGIEPEIFGHMLRYVYGGHISASEWENRAKDYIEAADKYGLINLKIEAEAWYVKFLEMEVEDVVETLIYADKLNCYLLKESAIDFIVKNSKKVLASKTLENIPESKGIMREIIFSIATMNEEDHASEDDVSALKNLSINDLRIKLDAEGKDIDGSRDVMIARLD